MSAPLAFLVQVRNPAVGGACVLVAGAVNTLFAELRNQTPDPIALRPGVAGHIGGSLVVDLMGNLPIGVVLAAQVLADGFTTGYDGQLRLTPTAPVVVLPGDRIVVTLSGLNLPAEFNAATSSVMIGWSGAVAVPADGPERPIEDGGRAMMLELHLPGRRPAVPPRTPPIALGWLAEEAGATARHSADGTVVISSQAAPIRNRLAFYIRNTSDAPLVPPGSDAKPEILINWMVGGDFDDRAGWRRDALTTVNYGLMVDVLVGSGNASDWQAESFMGLAYRLKPLTQPVLAARTSLVLILSNLICSLPEHPTALYVTWRGLPQYDDGTMVLPIDKVPAWPMVAAFDADCGPTAITLSDPVTLSWDCQGLPADHAPLSILAETLAGQTVIATDMPALGQKDHVPTEEFTTYSLVIPVPGAPAPARTRVQVGRATATLSASDTSIQSGGGLTLTYAYSYFTSATLTQNAAVVPIDTARLGTVHNGSGFTNVFPRADTTYTLRVEGLGGPAIATVDVTVVPDGPAPFDCYFVIGDQLHRFRGSDRTVERVGPLPGGVKAAEIFSFTMWPDPVIVTLRDRTAAKPGDPKTFTHVPHGKVLYPLVGRQLEASGFWYGVEVLDDAGKQVDWCKPFTLSKGLPNHVCRVGRRGWVVHDMWQKYAWVVPDDAPIKELMNCYSIDMDPMEWGFGRAMGATFANPDGFFVIDWTSDAGPTPPQPFCPTSGISTRILLARDQTFYWVENNTPDGPVLCRWVSGSQVLAKLPGPVDFNCFALAPEGRVDPAGAPEPFRVVGV